MNYDDIERNIRKQIDLELSSIGVSRQEIDPDDVQIQKHGNKIRINYKGFEVDIPAPSQEAIDHWWKDVGKFVAGGLMTLAGVVVGGIIIAKSQE